MKKIISVNNSGSSDALLLVLRIGVAAMMLTHGVSKMMMLLGGAPIQFPPVLGLSPETSLLLAVGAEVFGSVLVLTGTATRLAVVPLIVTMLVAALVVHSADPFATKEPALLYLLIYTALLIGGSGRYSVDFVLMRRVVRDDKGTRRPQLSSVS